MLINIPGINSVAWVKKSLHFSSVCLLLTLAVNGHASLTLNNCPRGSLPPGEHLTNAKSMNDTLYINDAELPHDNSVIYGLQNTGYSTEVEAVRAAANRFNPVSMHEDTEYIGAILQKGSEYFYSAQRGHAGEDQVSLRLRYPRTYKLVAFWHTHGAAAHERLYFSELDTKVAEQTGLPFYLADFSGELKVFQPGDEKLSLRKARKLGLPIKNGFAIGKTVSDRFGKLVLICTSNIQG